VAETTLKTLIDRIRGRPDWQHQDPGVRAEAVLRLPASEHELIAALAREDPDARVRRAAVKRIDALPLLAEVAAGDGDAGVVEEATARLAHAALHALDEASAQSAVAALRDTRQLAGVAKGAALASARDAAIRALDDPRALASVVREAQDLHTRQGALARIDDTQTLVGLAQNLEQKALAVAAVDRLSDPDALRMIAARARVAAAARRARARLETGEPARAPVPAAPAGVDFEAEQAAYEAARSALERETASSREREQLERAAREAAALRQADAATLARMEALSALAAEAEALAGQELATARVAFPALEARWRAAAGGVDAGVPGTRFATAAAALRERQQAARAELAAKEREHLEALQALAERCESLVAAQAAASLRETDHALREIKQALEHPGHLPSRRERDQLLGRLESARRQLYPLLQQLREDADWKRWANVSVQEELATRAEKLLSEANMERAAAALRELERRWREAREAPKQEGEALWGRFNAARDALKPKLDAYFAEQAERHAENLRRKQALCERAEALAESTDWVVTANALRALQAEWTAVGPVAHAQSQRIWERFRRPCDRFFKRFEQHRAERGREWEQNLAKKEALCARAEDLAGSVQWDEAAAAIKQLQADWRTIGPVKKSRADAVLQRFRSACDLFFDRYKNRDAHAREAAREARERICLELEALAPAEAAPAEPPADLVAHVLAAQTAWRQAGGLPQEEMAGLDRRFLAVRDRLLELFPRSFEGSELDPEASRRRAEKLVSRVEGLLAELEPAPASEAQSALDLAARLRDALASNTIGGKQALEQRWQSAALELEAAQAAWRRLGPLPGAEGRSLGERFDSATRRFAELRPRGERQRSDVPRQQRPRRDARGREGARPERLRR
jgi:exonuclease SbcC